MAESADQAMDKAPPNLGDTTSGASGPSRTVLDGPDTTRALTRITHEILERNRGSADLLLRGVHLPHRSAKRMSEVEGSTITAGALDATMYRDDLRLRPARSLEHTDIP